MRRTRQLRQRKDIFLYLNVDKRHESLESGNMVEGKGSEVINHLGQTEIVPVYT